MCVATLCVAVAPCSSASLVASPPSWEEKVLELEQKRVSQVVTATLQNGVRVQFRPMPALGNRVVVTATVVGGEMIETQATRGLTVLTASCLNALRMREEVGAESSPRFRVGRAGTGPTGLTFAGTADAIEVRCAGTVEQVTSALDRGVKLLTEPSIDPDTLESGQKAALERLVSERESTRASLVRALAECVAPAGDPRARALVDADVTRFGAEDVTAWVRRHMQAGGGAIEVSVVGGLDLREALALAVRTFGGLPGRPRPDDPDVRALRAMPSPVGPVRCSAKLPGLVDAVVVVGGTMTPDLDQLHTQRGLRVASRVLVPRVTAALADAGCHVLGDQDGPAQAESTVTFSPYLGQNMLLVAAKVEPEHAEQAQRVIAGELARLSDDGPTAQEIAPVLEDLAQTLERTETDGAYWSSLLARTSSMSIDPDRVANGAAEYKSMRPEQVRDALRACRLNRRSIEILLRPE